MTYPKFPKTPTLPRRPARSMMTRDAFARWVTEAGRLTVTTPFEIEVCRCGDVNCHGWRVIAKWRA